ncbi:hypothetical protein CPLU01_13893 [Colletotrichum plurivorum]|uniref:Uncharacterized protein n=1 Tax=Colletotrichum plurivorum TaxID=2175906 RepID=A0A8H6JNA6_9PEZI|nr:hypothetical protein CPLU01_13893 [Colletotrichum plurivorum]
MKASLVLTLSYLITAVWAGGYQNCLERVWLFQSYLIDQENPNEPDRQIGYGCSRWRNNNCVGNWVPCRPGRGTGRTRCDFDEFQRFLGNTPPANTFPAQAAYRPDGSLDNQQTAVNCLWAWRDNNHAPYNFRGYKAVRNGLNDHNNFISRVGQINNDNFNKPAVKAAGGGDAAFRRVDDTLTRITRARVGDHGRHLVPLARTGLNGVTVETKDLGANPSYRATWVPPPGVDPDVARWETVDWERTINNSANPAATRARVRTFLDGLYRGTTPNRNARDHWQVLRSYKTVKDRTNRCRK